MTKPKVKLSGKDGNAFFILGTLKRAADKAGWSRDEWNEVRTKLISGDYDNLLATAMEFFEVT